MSSDLEFLDASAKLVQDCIAETNRMLGEVRDPDIRAKLENSLGELQEAVVRIESERQRELRFLDAVENRRRIRESHEQVREIVEAPTEAPPNAPVDIHFAMKSRELLLAEYGSAADRPAAVSAGLDFEDWTQSRSLLVLSLETTAKPRLPNPAATSERSMDSWLQSSGAKSEVNDPNQAVRQQLEWERLLGNR